MAAANGDRMTVAELRELLGGFPGELAVVLDRDARCGDGGFMPVSQVVLGSTVPVMPEDELPDEFVFIC